MEITGCVFHEEYLRKSRENKIIQIRKEFRWIYVVRPLLLVLKYQEGGESFYFIFLRQVPNQWNELKMKRKTFLSRPFFSIELFENVTFF